jgi:hypothetical protein
MSGLPVYTITAAVIAASFVVLWTTTVNSRFWDRTLGVYRMFQSRREAFAKSALAALINIALVVLLFDSDSSLRFFIFFEMTYFVIAIGALQE